MKLRDHWAATAPLWSHGDSVLTWHVLFDGQLDLLASWLAPILDRPYLSPVPSAWLHLTVKGIGPAGGLSEQAVEDLVRDARAGLAELEPIDALVGPVRVVDQGVTADVRPAEPLVAVYDALPGVGGEEFWPHVTFAYATAEAEMDPIEANASDAAAIDAVTLIRLHRGERLYHWDVVAKVALGGAA